LVVLVSAVAWVGCARRESPIERPIAVPRADPAASGRPPQSTSAWPELAASYIEDRECADCHAAIAATYGRHPMGRSLRLAAGEPAEEASFDADGFRYEVRHGPDLKVHRQHRLGHGGRLVATISAPVEFVVGSGRGGKSYLVNREGYLFLSPITWYRQGSRWDLSPGYEVNNSEFNRPVIESCLFCHSNRALPIPDSLNRYEPPVFAGHAIGCQRCHGPGSEHVRYHRQGLSPADAPEAWVDLAGLPARRRDAVCQQCHQSGLVRVTTAHRRLTDYRPGMALGDCIAIFVRAAPESGDVRFVGHFEQMHRSRCFEGAGGQLSCVSCHDPHGMPPPEASAEFYRQRCLACHLDEGCSETPEARRQRSDDCTVCHMPALQTEIRHAATTNHRIVRTPDAAEQPGDDTRRATWPLVQFGDDPTAEVRWTRELALATVIARDRHPQIIKPVHVQLACERLERVVAADRNDIEALQTLATGRFSTGDLRGALDAVGQVLAQRPDREVARVLAAEFLAALRDSRQAAHAWQQALRLNPWMIHYWYSRAQSQAEVGDWPGCLETSQAAVERFPTSLGARYLLVESHLQLGNFQAAEDAFAEIEAFGHDRLPQLRQWFRNHPRRARSP
jgi:predicted CXXCH cytochrome family protein